MEATMLRDLSLRAAGLLAIAIAIGHGAIAELYVFDKAQIAPLSFRRLLRLIWQASTIDWIAVGVLLIAAPALGSEPARRWIVAVAIVVYGYAAIANAIAVGGWHPGWVVMTGAIALALMGL
jgi:hypothetical protein